MGLFGDIRELLQGQTSSPSKKLSYGRVSEVLDWPDLDPSPVEPRTSYYQLIMAEIWLAKEREWLSHYSPLVYAETHLLFGDNELHLPGILGEFKMAGNANLKNMADALRLNYPMTPRLPYNGGQVEFVAALVGVKTRDGVKDLISAASKLSGALAVPQLSTLVSVSEPIVGALNSMFSQGDRLPILGIHQMFQFGDHLPLREGYYIAARTDAQIDTENLMVNSDGRLAWKGAPASLVREFDYMLIRVNVNQSRDDLHSIRYIFDLVDQAKAKADGGHLDEANALIANARDQARKSKDLTTADQDRVSRAIKSDYVKWLNDEGIVPASPVPQKSRQRSSQKPKSRPTIPELVASMPVDEALRRVDKGSLTKSLF